MPQAFWVELFLKEISWRQGKALNLLGTLCRYVLADREWVDESIFSKNMWLTYIELHGVSHFPEWNMHIQADVGQIKVTEMSVKTLQ